MVNRYINLKDKNGVKISEGDILTLDVANSGLIDRNSNLAQKCKQENITKITVQMENKYPYLEVSYSLTFEPTGEVAKLKDYFFLKYIVSYCENQSKKDFIEIDLNNSGLININGKEILTKQELSLPIGKVLKTSFFKEDFKEKSLLNEVDSLVLKIDNEDFLIKLKYCFKKKDGSILTQREMSEVDNEEYEKDPSFYDEEYQGFSMPFKNHAEQLLGLLFE